MAHVCLFSVRPPSDTLGSFSMSNHVTAAQHDTEFAVDVRAQFAIACALIAVCFVLVVCFVHEEDSRKTPPTASGTRGPSVGGVGGRRLTMSGVDDKEALTDGHSDEKSDEPSADGGAQIRAALSNIFTVAFEMFSARGDDPLVPLQVFLHLVLCLYSLSPPAQLHTCVLLLCACAALLSRGGTCVERVGLHGPLGSSLPREGNLQGRSKCDDLLRSGGHCGLSRGHGRGGNHVRSG